MFSGCGHDINKQKELEFKEKELALKEKELVLKEKEWTLNEKDTISVNKDKPTASNVPTNDKKTVTNKCDGKNQITGRLIGAGNFWCPKVNVLTDKGEKWILLDNYDVKVDNQRLFKWSKNKLENYIKVNGDTDFPSEAIESSFLNKKFILCCKMGPTCGGDDPNAKEEYCIHIVSP